MHQTQHFEKRQTSGHITLPLTILPLTSVFLMSCIKTGSICFVCPSHQNSYDNLCTHEVFWCSLISLPTVTRPEAGSWDRRMHSLQSCHVFGGDTRISSLQTLTSQQGQLPQVAGWFQLTEMGTDCPEPPGVSWSRLFPRQNQQRPAAVHR